MIESVTIKNHAQSYTLHLARPEESGLAITNIDGLGPVKEEIAISDRGFLDGGYYHSSRASTRNIVLYLTYAPPITDKSIPGFTSDYSDAVSQMRHKTYKYFPQKTLLTFVFRASSGTYQISGYVESNEVNIFSDACSSVISILCPDPYFQKCQSIPGRVASVLSNTLTTTKKQFDFMYDGDINSDCLIRIVKKGTALINQVSIKNAALSSEMVLDISTLKDVGDFIEIVSNNGHRNVVASRKSKFGGVTMPAVDLIKAVSNEWISVVPGVNKFFVSRSTTATPDIEVTIVATIRTVGI